MIQSRNLFKKVSLIAAFSLVVGPLSAAECLQGEARYIDPESGLILTFSSFGENVQVMHQFTISHETSERSLSGFVIVDGEPLRPVSYVLNDCPDGDVTGVELEACTIWKGVTYGKFSDNNIGLLPLADEPAVTQVLLPDFARAVIASPVWTEMKITDEPFEVFDLKDCGAK